MKNQATEFQLDLRTSEADAAFAQNSQLKPDSLKSGFKLLAGEARKFLSTSGARNSTESSITWPAVAFALCLLSSTAAQAGPIHVWEIQQQANSGFNTNAGYAPALATYGNTVYMAWTNPGDSTIYYSHLSGSTWTTPVQVKGIFQGAEWIAETRAAPALAAFNNQLYLAWTGKHSAEIGYSIFNGSTWQHQSPVMTGGNTDEVTNFAPALATWGGDLYLAWTEADNTIWYSSLSPSAGTWTAATKLPGIPSNSVPGASNGPALAADGSGPYIAWNSDSTQSIWSSSLLGPAEKFTLPLHVLPDPPETSYSPGSTEYNNSVFIAWANGGTYGPVWVALLSGPSLAPTPIQVQGSGWEAETSAAPAMVSGGDSIYIAWSGRTGAIWWTTLTLELIPAAESDGCGLYCTRCCTPPPR
jgi:hypothetical protein